MLRRCGIASVKLLHQTCSDPARSQRQNHPPPGILKQQDGNLGKRDHALIMP